MLLIMDMIMFWCWLWWCLLIIMMLHVELLWWWRWWIIYVYVHICCWWTFLHANVGEIVGECMYNYNPLKLLLIIVVEIAVEYSHWIVVNICIVDWVICSCIICWVGCLHPYCRWPDTSIHIAVEIITVDNDVQLASGVTTSEVIWYHMHIGVVSRCIA